MDTAHVRENPSSNLPNSLKVQYLHFRYLKCLAFAHLMSLPSAVMLEAVAVWASSPLCLFTKKTLC